eukprot:Clim_evm17s23 gene=Clim_evmTU17s23
MDGIPSLRKGWPFPQDVFLLGDDWPMPEGYGDYGQAFTGKLRQSFGPGAAKLIRTKLIRPSPVTIRISNTSQRWQEVLEPGQEIWQLTSETILGAITKAASQISGKEVSVRAHSCLDDVFYVTKKATDSHVGTAWRSIQRHYYVILDRLCGEAVLKGADIYAGGIRVLPRIIQVNRPVHILIDVLDLTQPYNILPHESSALLYLGIGTLVQERTEIIKGMRGLAVTVDALLSPQSDDNGNSTHAFENPQISVNGFLRGLTFHQNVASACVAYSVDPQPEDVIYDMCSCPGAKFTHIGSLQYRRAKGNVKGFLVGTDVRRSKVRELRNTCAETSMTSFYAFAMDSAQSVMTKVVEEGERVRHGDDPVAYYTDCMARLRAKKWHGPFPCELLFDRILLDPPCSATGLRPRLVVHHTTDQLQHYVKWQRNFVWAALRLLKVGGTLTYSTCSIMVEENEEMVQYMLEEYKHCLELLPRAVDMPSVHSHPEVANPLGVDMSDKVLRFDPRDSDDFPGFFIARFRKTASVFLPEC